MSAAIQIVGVLVCIVTAGWSPYAVAQPRAQPVRPTSFLPTPLAPPAGAHLNYYGGRVVTAIQVVQVLWGAGAYLPGVSGTSTPSMASFYRGVLASPYVDWLAEYDTTTATGPGGASSQQVIQRGSFAGQYTIKPSPANDGSTIDDANIRSELARQIAMGSLPAPTRDAAGNMNTYYAVFFPPGKTITLGTQRSCVVGGFCSYHDTLQTTAGEIYYGAHPDLQSGTGCFTGCGTGATVFANQTSVASHELVETMTDPEVGLATAYAPPLGWYDPVNGEIGDICNAQDSFVLGSDGVTYAVQSEYSNVLAQCIVSRPGSGSEVPSGDGPLPLWALGALATGLVGVASRRLKRAA
jgi:hypothetical protein